MKLQIVSDLHIGFFKNPIKNWRTLIEPSADYLALLGDIHELRDIIILRKFLLAVCPNFKKVFYIMGNHEYYVGRDKQIDMKTLFDKFKEWCECYISNLIILENESYEIDNIKILGTTLWSHIPSKYEKEITNSINDYKFIKMSNRPITVDFINKLHEKAVLFLYDEIKKCEEEKKDVIILTHHAPLKNGTSSPLYEKSVSNYAYATELTGLFKENVKLACFGHTHHNCDFKFRNTRVVSNPRGYNSDDECFKKYKNNFVIEIN